MSELRDEIAAAMWDAEQDQPCAWTEATPVQRSDYYRMTDAVLALPAVRDALAAQEAVKRVRHLLDDCEPSEGYYLRRALDGDS